MSIIPIQVSTVFGDDGYHETGNHDHGPEAFDPASRAARKKDMQGC